MASTLLILCIYLLESTAQSTTLDFADDSDLTSFVTRPEIKAPLYDVSIYNASDLDTGYWFVAPYTYIAEEPGDRRYYQSFQTGPHIYDGHGNLVWSGAQMVQNRNTFDFRVAVVNGSHQLSALFFVYGEDSKGFGFILDNSYSMTTKVYPPPASTQFNMHEFKVLGNGSRALHFMVRPKFADVTALEIEVEEGWIADVGFREVDISSRATLFEWWALDHISPAESTVGATDLAGPPPTSWNWFHGNSIDKNSDGDYLVSARFTDCIYKVSADGSIAWRFGGTDSSFVLEDFNFSRQHDAQWLEYNDSREIILFFDNAADLYTQTSDYSSILVVELDKHAMVARVLKRFKRPDSGLTHARGNVQVLPSGNLFASWSENSYISEHAQDGRLLMEARFRSSRFVTYRAYKFDFVGDPVEPPTLKASVYGLSPATSTTVYYVSWNGATEVIAWRFLRNTTDGTAVIGEVGKAGFETMYQSAGCEDAVLVEAIAANGSTIGRSLPIAVSVPQDWNRTRIGNTNSDRRLSNEEGPKNCDTFQDSSTEWARDEL